MVTRVLPGPTPARAPDTVNTEAPTPTVETAKTWSPPLSTGLVALSGSL